MSALPPPTLPSAAPPPPSGGRGFRSWPLWAKVATPVVGVMAIGGIGNAISPPEDGKVSTVQPIAAVGTTVVPSTSAPVTSTTSTVVATTTVPVTAAPTAPSTAAPTAPPTAAPTAPPAPPTAPPAPPSTKAPAPATTQAPAPPAGGDDPRFGTCKEAIANGYGPYYAGIDPEYDWYRDGDNDGITCER